MKIAIVADSHGSIDRLDSLLANLKKAGVFHLLHAGDFAVYGVEDIFCKYPEIKIYVSQGNCDVNEELLSELNELPNVMIQEVIMCEIEGIKFGISHIEGIAGGVLSKEKIDIFCHGHTHRAKVEKKDGKVFLNPGALSEDGRYFLLSLPDLKLEQKYFGDII